MFCHPVHSITLSGTISCEGQMLNSQEAENFSTYPLLGSKDPFSPVKALLLLSLLMTKPRRKSTRGMWGLFSSQFEGAVHVGGEDRERGAVVGCAAPAVRKRTR